MNSSTTARFYNLIARVYPVIDWFLRAHKQRLSAYVQALPPGRLLDVGVGTGSQLAAYGPHLIVGIDLSEAMLRVSRQRELTNVSLYLMDGEAMQFADKTFDYVVLSHVLAVASNPNRLLTNCFRVLKPGGRLLILNHFTPTDWLGTFDRLVAPVASWLRLRSAFTLTDLPELARHGVLTDHSADRFAYFHLLIYRKI